MIEVHTAPCLGCADRATFTMTDEQFARFQAGEHVQRIFPDWSAGDREMLISGKCPSCWREMWETMADEDDGYLLGDEDSDWLDSEKDWYVD